MSAPDTTPARAWRDTIYVGDQTASGRQDWSSNPNGFDRGTVQTYHHDRILKAALAERDDLRQRLGRMTALARGAATATRKLCCDGDPHGGCVMCMARDAAIEEIEIESAIEAAKGGE